MMVGARNKLKPGQPGGQSGLSWDEERGTTRNLRDVWSIATHSYPGSHFATWPPELVSRIIKMCTSEKGACPMCGNQWERVIEKTSQLEPTRKNQGLGNTFLPRVGTGNASKLHHVAETKTTGWLPTCDCYNGPKFPQVIPMPSDAMPPEYCENCNGSGEIELWGMLSGKIKKCSVCNGKPLLEQPNDIWLEWNRKNEEITQKRVELAPFYATQTTVPALVLDPFCGSGTTLQEARRLGRSAIGCDLSMTYLQDCAIPRLSLRELAGEAIQGGGSFEDLPLFQKGVQNV